MKTIVTFLIALLAFATSLAWAGPEAAPTNRATIEQSQAGSSAPSAHSASAAKPAAAASRQVTPQRVDAARNAANGSARTDAFSFELPAAGPAVICACVTDKRLG